MHVIANHCIARDDIL